eukprot:9487205-Pyramimonas_sp.AAC.1
MLWSIFQWTDGALCFVAVLFFKLALKSIGSVVDWVHAVIAWRLAHGASRPRGRPPAKWDDR